MVLVVVMIFFVMVGVNVIFVQVGIVLIVGMVQVFLIVGVCYNGGLVLVGGLYQVGEKGKLEIYQVSIGKQYMIFGDNGKVISNKDMQLGGGISVQVNVINQFIGVIVQSVNGYMQDGSVVVDLLIIDMERGGFVFFQMQQIFGLSCKV